MSFVVYFLYKLSNRAKYWFSCLLVSVNFSLTVSLSLFWTWLVSKGGLKRAGQFVSSTEFETVAIQFFQMSLKSTKFDSSGVKITIFFWKITIIAQKLGSLPPDPRLRYSWVPPICAAQLRHISSKNILTFEFKLPPPLTGCRLIISVY